MKDSTLGSIFIGIVSNLITAIIIPIISIFLGIYLNISIDNKLAIFNMALILTTIVLILNMKYTPRRVRVIRTFDMPHVYLVEKNIARHIPDEATFKYLGQLYGFDWKDIEKMNNEEFMRNFSSGSVIHSIIPHCIEYNKKMKETDSNVKI